MTANKENAEEVVRHLSDSRILKPKQCDATIHRVSDLLVVPKQRLDFNTVLAGQVLEEDLQVILKTSQQLHIKMSVICENDCFQESDILSLRKCTNYDYNDELTTKLTTRTTPFKVAIKVNPQCLHQVPNIRESNVITGLVIISVSTATGV